MPIRCRTGRMWSTYAPTEHHPTHEKKATSTHTTTRPEPQNITEKPDTKAIHRVTLLMCNVQNGQSQRDRKPISGCQGLGGGAGKRALVRGAGFPQR